MDPNATWQMLCEYLRALHQHPDDEEIRANVLGLLETLTRWLRRGGFPPTITEEIPMSRHGLYQPKIADEHIRQLYQWAKRLNIPMTHLLNALLEHALERLEQGVENVSEAAPAPYRRRRTQRAEEK